MKTRIALLLTLALVLVSYGLAQQTQDKTDTAGKADKNDLEFPHDGKTDDVNAIGNRNVGCSKGLGNWYSLESQ